MSFLFFAEQENPTGKLANEETEDFERLGSFSFLLALFFFFHKKKKKAEPMDSADGRSNGYTVGKYTGPVVADGKFKIIRETGNGVKQEIEYDPIKKRPTRLVTKMQSDLLFLVERIGSSPAHQKVHQQVHFGIHFCKLKMQTGKILTSFYFIS